MSDTEKVVRFGNLICEATGKLTVSAAGDEFPDEFPEGTLVVDASAAAAGQMITHWLLYRQEDGSYTHDESGENAVLAEHLVNIAGCYIPPA